MAINNPRTDATGDDAPGAYEITVMKWRRDRDVAVTIALVGVSFILGGEALCFFAPLRHASAVDLVCQTFFYSGAGLIAIAAAVHIRSGRRRAN